MWENDRPDQDITVPVTVDKEFFVTCTHTNGCKEVNSVFIRPSEAKPCVTPNAPDNQNYTKGQPAINLTIINCDGTVQWYANGVPAGTSATISVAPQGNTKYGVNCIKRPMGCSDYWKDFIVTVGENPIKAVDVCNLSVKPSGKMEVYETSL